MIPVRIRVQGVDGKLIHVSWQPGLPLETRIVAPRLVEHIQSDIRWQEHGLPAGFQLHYDHNAQLMRFLAGPPQRIEVVPAGACFIKPDNSQAIRIGSAFQDVLSVTADYEGESRPLAQYAVMGPGDELILVVTTIH